VLVLGIESSCDETAFAVVDRGGRVLANAVASQVELHARFGGVVPEIASRAHLECCVPLYRQALAEAGVGIGDIGAVAVARGPGLAGCLLVGVEFAKGLALRHGKPLVGVHHIAGHIDSVHIGRDRDAWGDDVRDAARPFAPYLALVVSGGHSSLVRVDGPLRYETLGETLDDAVGEAYDKVAKLLGLGYPGGPLLDRLASTVAKSPFELPRPLMDRGGYDFSFSGLKTAVARLIETQAPPRDANGALPAEFVANVAAAFQEAAVDVLLKKAKRALDDTGIDRLAIAGGVACNRGLRAAVAKRLPRVRVAMPAPEFCTDNAAMMAGLAHRVLDAGVAGTLGMNADPSLELRAEAWNAVAIA